MTVTDKLTPCPGCGALVPAIDGPTHAYIGASPGCWAVYGEVMAREFGEYRYPQVHRLTVDTYAVQHPGEPERRSIQSVAVHLVSLYFVLERDFDAKRATDAIRRALDHRERFVWLDPTSLLGAVTVLDVHAAQNLTQHTAVVEKWARSVWDAWSPHHETVRQWAESSVPER